MDPSTHTPGPWRVTAIPAGNSPTIMFSGSYGVDLIDCTGNDNPPNPADVALMASAPELLAELDALRATVADLRGALESLAECGAQEHDLDMPCKEDECALCAARAALAKVQP